MDRELSRPTVGKRLKSKRKEAGINQYQLSALSGVSQRQISAYEREKSEPRLDTLEKLASALNTSTEWLEFGDEESDIDILTEEYIKESLGSALHVPVLNWDLQSVNRTKFHIPCEYIPVPDVVSDEAFALQVKGESMSPEYSPGCLIVVDPNVEATNGSDVVVEVGDGVSFKRLAIEPGGETFLRPLNPQYPVTQVTSPDYKIIGVVALQIIYRLGRRE